MLEYAIVFVLTSTSKYAYIRYHRIYTEIRSYLLITQLVLNFRNFFASQYNAVVDVGSNPPTVEKVAIQVKHDKHVVIDVKVFFFVQCLAIRFFFL